MCTVNDNETKKPLYKAYTQGKIDACESLRISFNNAMVQMGDGNIRLSQVISLLESVSAYERERLNGRMTNDE